jgi:hypothetical protein
LEEPEYSIKEKEKKISKTQRIINSMKIENKDIESERSKLISSQRL